jgi:hypothetical protein
MTSKPQKRPRNAVNAARPPGIAFAAFRPFLGVLDGLAVDVGGHGYRLGGTG